MCQYVYERACASVHLLGELCTTPQHGSTSEYRISYNMHDITSEYRISYSMHDMTLECQISYNVHDLTSEYRISYIMHDLASEYHTTWIHRTQYTAIKNDRTPRHHIQHCPQAVKNVFCGINAIIFTTMAIKRYLKASPLGPEKRPVHESEKALRINKGRERGKGKEDV
jgi:hypothetical protein